MSGGGSSRRLTLVVALAGATGGSATAAGIPLSRCTSAPGERALNVRLDRSGVLPGMIGLRVRVLPPVAPNAGETVLALAGGPGQAAAPLLEQFATVLGGRLLRARRLVTFDQRGTGRSGRLACRH